MEQKKEKGLQIRSCLTGAIWLALVFSTVISALLFAFLNHFFNLPGSIPVLGWLLIFNTLIAGLITSFINAKLLEPITRLSKAMKEVSQGDFEQHLETNSRIAEVGESYQSFNVMTKELRATEVLQMDFVSDVSHEFKTPINAIEGYTMLLQGEELSPDQEEYVEKILFNTQRLSGLVGNILLLSKLENQNIPMKKTEYRLDEQIRQAFLSLETKWTEKEIGFQVELEEVKYTGNEGLFMHIWINLLDNAIKFSPSKGTITMFLKQEQDSVKFILEDEGPGIEDDVKSRIFDKFYQVDGSHKAEGNGLGLALVKRIVDSAGGTIKAENREYGGWQICQILCVPIVLCIAELCNMPRAMWAGIAAMSVILPSMEDMHYRVRKRIVGNIAGVICFTVLYFLLPSSIYAYIGILGGIGVGFSAQYGWQAVFNTFGALAIAAETYGLQGAVSLRVSQNVFGVVFALAFCVIFYWFMPKKRKVR